jgi:hypothetical protein
MLLDDLLDTRGFAARHIGPDERDERAMLEFMGLASREALIAEALPAAIRQAAPLELPAPRTESEALAELRALAARNQVWRTYIGMGYCGTHTPQVIQRNVLENPGWYTPYTPYQAEISQGRLEALLAFQQMLINLTGLPVANASLLDEATAAGEAMGLIQRHEDRAEGVLCGCGMPSAGDHGHPHPRPLARHPWSSGMRHRTRSGASSAHTCSIPTRRPRQHPSPLIARLHAAGGWCRSAWIRLRLCC